MPLRRGFLYLCSADGKRLTACAFRHKLSAFLCRLCCPAGAPCCQESRAELPHAAAVCCTKVSHTRLWFQSRVPRNPGAVSLDSSGAAGRAAVKIQTGPAAALPRSAPQQYRPPTQSLVLQLPRSKLRPPTPAPAHSIYSSTPPRPRHNRS